HDLPPARVEEKGQVDAGDHEDHEAVESDLPQHERPVVGEHLVERGSKEVCRAETIVDPAHETTDHRLTDPSRVPGGRAGESRSTADSQATTRPAAPIT